MSIAKVVELKDNYVITKSNSLITDVKYKTTLLEFKFLAVMTSLVQPNDDNFKYYKIKTKELIDYLGFGKNARAYNDLYSAIKSLQKKTITVYEEDGWTDISWIASARYRDKQGVIEFEFSERLKPYLLQLKDNFTKYEVVYIKNLTSVHSARIYELIKQWSFRKKDVEIEVGELKQILGLEDKYKLYGDFKRNVLEVAKQEIPQKTDLSFDYREEKSGRKVARIIFCNITKIKHDLPEIPLEDLPEKIMDIDQEMVDAFLSVGLNSNQAEELIEKGFDAIEDKSGNLEKSASMQSEVKAKFPTPSAYFQSKIALFKMQHQQKPKRNPVGFLLEAIKFNYVDKEAEKVVAVKHKRNEVAELRNELDTVQKKLEEVSELRFGEQKIICDKLVSENPELLSEIADQYNIRSSVGYKPQFSLEENYNSLMVGMQIKGAIQEKYPNLFLSIQEKYQDQILILEAKKKDLENSIHLIRTKKIK